MSWSQEKPQLVARLRDGETAREGAFVCTLDLKSMVLSEIVQLPPDVMSDPDEFKRRQSIMQADLDADSDADTDVDNIAIIDMQNNPLHARRLAQNTEMNKNPLLGRTSIDDDGDGGDDGGGWRGMMAADGGARC